MLASLLPGLRDLRVPLSSGLIWLFVAWLIVYPTIPQRAEANGLVSKIYEVFDAFGPALLATVVSFIGYVLGILVARPTIAISRALVRLARAIVGTPVAPKYPQPVKLSASSEEQAFQLATSVARQFSVLAASRDPDSPRGRWNQNEAQRIQDRFLAVEDGFAPTTLMRRMGSDVPLVATRLLADNRELFDRYDRADAESAFRYCVAPPLFVAVLLLAWRTDVDAWGWVVAIGVGALVAMLLLADGARKEMESNDAIYQAVFAGSVHFPSIEAAQRNLDALRERERRLGGK